MNWVIAIMEYVQDAHGASETTTQIRWWHEFVVTDVNLNERREGTATGCHSHRLCIISLFLSYNALRILLHRDNRNNGKAMSETLTRLYHIPSGIDSKWCDVYVVSCATSGKRCSASLRSTSPIASVNVSTLWEYVLHRLRGSACIWTEFSYASLTLSQIQIDVHLCKRFTQYYICVTLR